MALAQSSSTSWDEPKARHLREEKSRERGREIQCAIVSDIMRKMRDNREFELLCETRHVIVGKIFLQFDIGLTSIN